MARVYPHNFIFDALNDVGKDMVTLFNTKRMDQKMYIKASLNKACFKWLIQFQSYHQDDPTCNVISKVINNLKEVGSFSEAIERNADRARLYRSVHSTLYHWVVNPMQVKIENEAALRECFSIVLIVKLMCDLVYVVPHTEVVNQFGSLEQFALLNDIWTEHATMHRDSIKTIHDILINKTWEKYLVASGHTIGVPVSRIITVHVSLDVFQGEEEEKTPKTP